MASSPPPGWHPDPADPSASIRWWDGERWTEQTRPAPAGAPDPWQPPQTSVAQAPTALQQQSDPYGGMSGQQGGQQPGWQQPGGPYGTQGSGGWQQQSQYGTGSQPARGGGWRRMAGAAGGSFASRNSASFTAIAVAAAYILLAAFAHIVFLGIVPVLATVRAFQRRETLAPVALVAAAVAIVLAFTLLAHR